MEERAIRPTLRRWCTVRNLSSDGCPPGNTAPGGASHSRTHTGPVTECGRVSEELLEKEKKRGEAYFRREYLCEFMETGKYLIDEEMVKDAFHQEEEAWRFL